MLNTREYEVEFPDGTVEEYTTNIIVENLFSQCDTEGNQFFFLKDIVDHHSNRKAVCIEDGYWTSKNGTHYPKKTTAG